MYLSGPRQTLGHFFGDFFGDFVDLKMEAVRGHNFKEIEVGPRAQGAIPC